MRQCSQCLRFLPNSRFYRCGNRLASWCADCTRNREAIKTWKPDAKPLQDAISHWITQQGHTA